MTRVRYFAAAEEAAGAAEEVRGEHTLVQLQAGIVRDHPALDGILFRCAVLVDGARHDDCELTDATVVDVLPPFAGG